MKESYNKLDFFRAMKIVNNQMNSGNIVAHGNRSEILEKGDLMSSLTGVEN